MLTREGTPKNPGSDGGLPAAAGLCPGPDKAFAAERDKTRELHQAYRETLHRSLRAAHYKDEETGAHLRRLSHYAQTLARALVVPDADAALIAAALLHDVGKIGVPDAVLRKRSPLDPQ